MRLERPFQEPSPSMGEGWVGVCPLSLGEELGWAPTPPAPFAKVTAFTPSQPSPIEGEGS